MSEFDRCRWDVTYDDECDLEDIKFDLLEEQEQRLDIASFNNIANNSISLLPLSLEVISIIIQSKH